LGLQHLPQGFCCCRTERPALVNVTPVANPTPPGQLIVMSNAPHNQIDPHIDGNVTNDANHTYSWDADGNSISIDVGLTFDAFDRIVEQNRSGTYTEIVYTPTGHKLALMNGTAGQALQKAFVPLPGRDTASDRSDSN